MSFDLKLPTLCNHKIYKELTTLDTDRRSLRLSKPLTSGIDIKVYASDNLVPSSEYGIIYDPNTIEVNQPRMIYFHSKWKSVEDFFQVSYNTVLSFCPKCVGLKSLDDISYNIRGDLLIHRNEDLLLQNLEKYTVTELGSNPFHSFFGTSLVTLLGEKMANVNYTRSKVIQEINSTLSTLKDLQGQYQMTNRVVTQGELLDKVNNIQVAQDENDPTILRADIDVTSKSGEQLSFTQYLKTSAGT